MWKQHLNLWVQMLYTDICALYSSLLALPFLTCLTVIGPDVTKTLIQSAVSIHQAYGLMLSVFMPRLQIIYILAQQI